MAINKKSVFQAADSIVARNQKPTLERVREELKGGSYSTIGPLMREWRDSQSAVSTALVDMPDGVKSAFDRAGQVAWSEAVKVASNRVNAAEDRLAEVENDRQTAEEQFEKEIGLLENKLEQKDEEIKKLKIKVAARDESNRLLDLKASKLQGQAEADLQFRTQLEAFNERVAKIESAAARK